MLPDRFLSPQLRPPSTFAHPNSLVYAGFYAEGQNKARVNPPVSSATLIHAHVTIAPRVGHVSSNDRNTAYPSLSRIRGSLFHFYGKSTTHELRIYFGNVVLG